MVTSDTDISQIINIKSIARSLKPEWSFLDDWLLWPPDVFALTSILLQRTGCYRICLIEDWWTDPRWAKEIDKTAKAWISNVSKAIDKSQPQSTQIALLEDDKLLKLQEQVKIIVNADNLHVDMLRILTMEQVNIDRDEAYTKQINENRKVAQALVTLHALADAACSFFGQLTSLSNETIDNKVTHCLANLLLTATGSLSNLPKFHGMVLPKIRTPQSGQTLRSMSHHLTFHASEVEVIWRTIPWFNSHEKTLNIMAVPWPYEIKDQSFKETKGNSKPVRYFEFEPPQPNNIPELDQIVELIKQQVDKVSRIHILVFPEASLSENDYYSLIGKLHRNRREIKHLPIIVAGVRKKEQLSASKSDLQPDKGQLEEALKSHNEVRLAVHFGGRWYDMAQRKHHRWRLDHSQVCQYQLEGKLPTSRDWLEHISVSQRRLTILAPNSWLSLTSLVCEDLARLEPVSELIRGIGPTLLLALLSDGPQLKERWSARYASVLADDPGTAVLTLTSLGMSKRSKHPRMDDSLDESEIKKLEKDSRIIGLWKDMIRGYRPLTLKEPCGALLLTVSADWVEEYTMDGRSDNYNAAAFKVEGVQSLILPEQVESQTENIDSIKSKLGKWGDIRELSVFTYILDTLIESGGRLLETIGNWLAFSPDLSLYNTRYSEILKNLSVSLQQPHKVGIDARRVEWSVHKLSEITELVKQLIPPKGENQESLKYYEILYNNAKSEFNKIKEEQTNTSNQAEVKSKRIRLDVPLAILTILHAKLSGRKSLKRIIEEGLEKENVRKKAESLRAEIKEFILAEQHIIEVEYLTDNPNTTDSEPDVES